MKKGKIRVVFDTNWWVSFVINRFKSQLSDALVNPRLRFYSSAELDKEIFETLDLPHLQKFVRPEIKAEFLALYPAVVAKVPVFSEVALCRDPKDNFLLALSQDAQADYLVTGDKDLLVLGKFGKTRILKMTDFLEAINA